MQDGFLGRLQHAWNAFRNKDIKPYPSVYSSIYTGRPDRYRFRFGTDRSIVAPLYTRIAIDVAAVSIQHVRVNQNGNFIEKSSLD